MGNWFTRIEKAVHPLDKEGEDIKSTLISPSSSGSSLRIKVRMTTTQLKELIAKVDKSHGHGNSEIGSMILQECLNGRLPARVVVGDEDLISSSQQYSRNLFTIKEE